jgi:hypothetical protein
MVPAAGATAAAVGTSSAVPATALIGAADTLSTGADSPCSAPAATFAGRPASAGPDTVEVLKYGLQGAGARSGRNVRGLGR